MKSARTELKIGEVAEATGMGIEAIRFYEKSGLIDKPQRGALSNYREYDARVVQRLSFIAKAKDLGFTLAEIKDLLELKIKKTSKCEAVKNKALLKLEMIKTKMNQLSEIKCSLEKLVEKCETNSPTSDCPLLDAMEKNFGPKGGCERG